jgi:plastocyanin
MISIRVAATVAFLTTVACGGGGGGGGSTSTPTGPPPAPAATVVAIEDNQFVPKQLTIEPGTLVRWVHQGTASNHTTTEMAMTWDSGFVFLQQGDSFEHMFTEADEGKTFEYSCVTHKGCCLMQVSVRVGESAPPPSTGY